MNDTEKIIFDTLFKLVADYESADNEDLKKKILKKINEVSTSEIEQDFLDKYWKSMDSREFCQIHSVIKADIADNTEAEVQKYLHTILDSTEDPELLEYAMNKYCDAIEYFYKKSSGTLMDLIYQEDINEFDKLLTKLKKSDVIVL